MDRGDFMHLPTLLLGSSTDMLSKARRELARLRDDVNIDTVFNYFVTAHHVQDYLRAETPDHAGDVDALLADPDLIVCRSICNQGKHLKVDRRASPVGEKLSGRSGVAGIGVVGEMVVGAGIVWDLTYDGASLDPIALAERVLAKLEKFFVAHGISTTQ
jgi:hypothetical protein